MEKRRHRITRAALALLVVAALATTGVIAASCGGGDTATKETESATTKLPPGATESGVAESSTTPTSTQTTSSTESESTTEQSESTTKKTPSESIEVYEAKFTVVSATRPDTNDSVISSSGREVAGDYLEVEFTIENQATDHLVNLSEYSFRLQSSGIATGTYSNYYGPTVGTYGQYIGEDEICATLLNYSDLEQVTYLLKEGEIVDEVFLFFDLNPEDVDRNADVTKDNTELIIYKASGTEAGTSETISLSGYPDS